MRVTENPETGVFVRTSNASVFFVQPDRGGGAVVTGAVSHARIHVFSGTGFGSYWGSIPPRVMTETGWEADIAQCDTALEKPFMITTPTTMKPIPIMAAESSFWPWISQATAATNTTPKPAQIA